MKLFTSLDLCDQAQSTYRYPGCVMKALQDYSFTFIQSTFWPLWSSRTSRNHIIRIVLPYEVDITNLLAASKHIQQIWSNISIHLVSCFWPPDEFSLYFQLFQGEMLHCVHQLFVSVCCLVPRR